MHVIRLRFPWEKSQPGIETRRVDVPELERSAGEDPLAACRYVRNFNRPPNLDLTTTRVYLRVAGWEGTLVEIRLNDQTLPLDEQTDGVEVEITELLEPSNRIVIQLAGQSNIAARLNGEVTLAIDVTD